MVKKNSSPWFASGDGMNYTTVLAVVLGVLLLMAYFGCGSTPKTARRREPFLGEIMSSIQDTGTRGAEDLSRRWEQQAGLMTEAPRRVARLVNEPKKQVQFVSDGGGGGGKGVYNKKPTAAPPMSASTSRPRTSGTMAPTSRPTGGGGNYFRTGAPRAAPVPTTKPTNEGTMMGSAPAPYMRYTPHAPWASEPPTKVDASMQKWQQSCANAK